MKKTILLLVGFILNLWSVQAQTKSTGVVSLPVSGMTAKLDLNNVNSTVTLTLTGPSDRWFALQFGDIDSGEGMQAGQDVVYYNGTTLIDAVHNGIGAAPSTDTNNWTVTSNTVASGTRTIVATRAFNTGNTNDYTFVFANNSVDFASAKMNSASYTLAYHGGANRGYSFDVPYTTLGVNDFEYQKNSIKLYPNPTEDYLNIESENVISSVKVYDSNGKLIKHIKNKTILKIDLSELRTGVYYLELESNKNLSYERIVKK
jgi:hypothetical protein